MPSSISQAQATVWAILWTDTETNEAALCEADEGGAIYDIYSSREDAQASCDWNNAQAERYGWNSRYSPVPVPMIPDAETTFCDPRVLTNDVVPVSDDIATPDTHDIQSPAQSHEATNMMKIYAVTFKDENGKYTVQDTMNFRLSYDDPNIPQISPWGTIARELAEKHGCLEALDALKASILAQGKDAFMCRGYNERDFNEMMRRDPSYISWYIPNPTLDKIIPADAFKMMPWINPEWRDDAKILAKDSPLPWPYDPIEDHYAHLHFKEDVATGKREPLVRFFATPDHGAVRRATDMKPGKYLTKYYPALDGDTVRHWVTLIDAADSVRFAVTADEIKTVYQNGPRSCMAYNDDRYESNVHPTAVYGDSDLQLAYLSFVDLDQPNFRATARALVWPERKVYGRIYGDEHRMDAALEKLGYRAGSLKGAKIKRIEQDYGEYLVMPYIDGCCSITIHDDYCTIGGNHSADSTSGLVALESGTWCDGYEDYVSDDPNEFEYVSGYGNLSPSYLREYFFQCDRTGRWCHQDDAVNMANGETWSQRAFDSYGSYCQKTDEAYPDDEIVYLEDTEEYVCISWAETNAYLSDDGTWYSEKPEEEAPFDDVTEEEIAAAPEAKKDDTVWIDAATIYVDEAA